MTALLANPVLSPMLHGSDTAVADDRLRWMVLTWDLAPVRSSVKTCVRVFLTDDSFLGIHGLRSPEMFDSLNPSLGTVDETRFCSPKALEFALDYSATEAKIGGVRMLCRPLAVDLSRYADPDIVEKPPWRDAGALLSHMESGSRKGFSLLADINRARAAAMDTHMVADWERTFPGADRDDLWSGR